MSIIINKIKGIFKKQSYETDMTSGNFFKKIVWFCIPLTLTGILQLLYNAADLIVVGNFSDEAGALGAVGSTSALINLIVNLFMGLSVGANIICAKRYASKDEEGLSRVVHTSVAVSVLCGIFLGIIGFIFAKQFLDLMNNPIDLAVVYLKIYFCGMPFNLLYNFCASILRGVGDTKRPLYYLIISGFVNVILNLFFVIVLKMDVDGVATATVISQIVSCILIMNCLIKTNAPYKFSIKKLHIYKDELFEITKIGLPAGIQGSVFSISNVIIQSSVNKFGQAVINGNSAAQSIEGFVYTAMNSVYHAALAFTGQNVGAKKYENIKKIRNLCLLVVTMFGVIMGGTFYLLGNPLTEIYTKVPSEVKVSLLRLNYLCLPYFLCGIMDVMVGLLRGIGYSIAPMIVSIIGVCGFRIAWIYLVFYRLTEFNNYVDLQYLYISYPISWIITFAVHFTCFQVLYHKLLKKHSSINNEIIMED